MPAFWQPGFCCVNFALLALGMRRHSQSLYAAIVCCWFYFCCIHTTWNVFIAAWRTNLEHVLMLEYMQFSQWRYVFPSLSAETHSQLRIRLSHNGMLVNLYTTKRTVILLHYFLGCQLWFRLSAAAMLLPTSRRL